MRFLLPENTGCYASTLYPLYVELNVKKNLLKPAVSSIQKMPNELLRGVFEHLNYWDLRLRCPLVCRRFQSIIEAKSKAGIVDKTLFRDAPLQKPLAATPSLDVSYTIHPAFGTLKYSLSHSSPTDPWTYYFIAYSSPDNLKHVHFPVAKLGEDRQWTLALTDTAVATENAVSPAVDRLVLNAMGYDPREIYNEDGSPVTVSQVMAAFVGMECEYMMNKVMKRYVWDRVHRVRLVDGVVNLYVDGYKE